MSRVLVVGAGIHGLATAIDRHIKGDRVVILEAKPRIGGRGTSEMVQGFHLDHGPHLLLKGGRLHSLVKRIGGLRLALRPLRPHKINVIGSGMLYPKGDMKAIMRLRKREDECRESAIKLISSWGIEDFERRTALMKGKLMVPAGGWAGIVGRLASGIDEAGIPIRTSSKVKQQIEGGVILTDGTKVAADEVIMCIGPKKGGLTASTYDAIISSKPFSDLHAIVKDDIVIFDLNAINPLRSPGYTHLSCIALSGGIEAIEKLLDERALGWREHLVTERRNENIRITDDGFLSDARV